MSFNGASAKLVIGSLDNAQLEVAAQYNPAQIERQRSIGWTSHNPHNIPLQRRGALIKKNDLEYTGGEGRELTLELLFDGVETDCCVEPQMEALDLMATSRDVRKDRTHDERRPHQCVVVWGVGGIKPMACVITSLTVKYTMFASDGRPLRAVATVKVKEAVVTRLDNDEFKSRHKRPVQLTEQAKSWSERQITLAPPGEVILRK